MVHLNTHASTWTTPLAKKMMKNALFAERECWCFDSFRKTFLCTEPLKTLLEKKKIKRPLSTERNSPREEKKTPVKVEEAPVKEKKDPED